MIGLKVASNLSIRILNRKIFSIILYEKGIMLVGNVIGKDVVHLDPNEGTS